MYRPDSEKARIADNLVRSDREPNPSVVNAILERQIREAIQHQPITHTEADHPHRSRAPGHLDRRLLGRAPPRTPVARSLRTLPLEQDPDRTGPRMAPPPTPGPVHPQAPIPDTAHRRCLSSTSRPPARLAGPASRGRVGPAPHQGPERWRPTTAESVGTIQHDV